MCYYSLRLTMRTKSFFILPTTIKILHTNNVKVSKDQKMKKNQRLTRPSWRKGELIEGSLARFLQTPPSYVKQPRLYKWRYELQFDVNVLTGCKPKIMYSFWLSLNVIFKFMTNWIQNYANRKNMDLKSSFIWKLALPSSWNLHIFHIWLFASENRFLIKSWLGRFSAFARFVMPPP